MSSFTNVVVGTDGSESSYRAVDRAASLAKDSGATLHVVSAFPASDVTGQPGPQIRAFHSRGHERDTEHAEEEMGFLADRGEASEVADAALSAASARATAAGANNIKTQAYPGEPVEVLLEVAAVTGADLLVVGNRGLNTLSGRLFGSVPHDIARKATCDVLIVHTTD